MHGISVNVRFGGRGGWNEVLPGLDWAVLASTAFRVLFLHFVLAGVIREANRRSGSRGGLGSEWGRNALDSQAFSNVFIKSYKRASETPSEAVAIVENVNIRMPKT